MICAADVVDKSPLHESFCGECGAEVLDEFGFCPDCGTSLKEISAPTRKKQESEPKAEAQVSGCVDDASKSPETVTSNNRQKLKKNKRGIKFVLLIFIAYGLIIISVFCYFYIRLYGWEAVPFVDYLKFLPFAGNLPGVCRI